MDEMKFDMCGAASVFGTIKTMMEMDLPVNVVGIVPTVENMPSGRLQARRRGHQHVGTNHRDTQYRCRGSIDTCDALTYAGRFKPRYVIDIATRTGAAIIALGKVPSVIMGNDSDLLIP